MKVADFEFDLPPERIAQRPLEARDGSRLMVVDRTTEVVDHRRFSDLVDLLDPGDLLVDGLPATGASFLDADTLLFTLPTLSPGVHEMTIADGAITSSVTGNAPVRAFSSQFIIASLPSVETLTPQNLSSTGATLRVNISDVGFDNPDLTIYLGDEDVGMAVLVIVEPGRAGGEPAVGDSGALCHVAKLAPAKVPAPTITPAVFKNSRLSIFQFSNKNAIS